MKLNVVGKRNIPFIASCVLFVLSIISLLVFGLKPGIDFTSGSLIEIGFTGERPAQAALQSAIEPLNLGTVVIQTAGDDAYLLRMKTISREEREGVLAAFQKTFGDAASTSPTIIERRFETIGPSVSAELRSRASEVILFVVILIIAFISYAFRKVAKPVESWKYGVVAVVAMIHDVVITLGIFAALGHYRGVEIDITFIVAILTIFGYSINDTIVVFDRIREHLIRRPGASFRQTVNDAVNETLARSLNTTFTTLLVLGALLFFGGVSIHNFALALFIGIALGAYSSLFVASPLLVYVEEYSRRRRARIS